MIEDLFDALERLAATDGDDTDGLIRRTRHVITEIDRTRRLVALLQGGQPLRGEKLTEADRFMDAPHELLRVGYEYTCPELDVTVETARVASARGTRMTGGGFGGSVITLVDADTVYGMARAVAKAYRHEGFNPPAFLDAVPAALVGRPAQVDQVTAEPPHLTTISPPQPRLEGTVSIPPSG